MDIGDSFRRSGRRVVAPHPLREKILDTVQQRPGSNSTRLEELLAVSRGRLRHHLRVLEDAGLLKRVPFGRENHYFPPDAECDEIEVMSRAQHGRAWKILGVVLAEPGVKQMDLARRVGMTRKVLRSKLNDLVGAGILLEVADGRLRRYVLGPRVNGLVRAGLEARLGAPAPEKTREPTGP